MRKYYVNRYYDLYSKNNTQLDRQINRYLHDPIHYLEGTNENVSIKPIKGRRIG